MRSMPRGIWVLLAANVVIALGYGLIAPVLPGFARSFGVSLTAASAVVSAFAVMRLIFAPATGRLVTRLGERRIYLTGLLIVAVSTLACAFAQTYWQLLVFRAAGGIGSTMFTVSAMALLIRMAPPTVRGQASGYFSAGFLMGNLAGPLIGSALVGFGLRMPFVVYSVALIIALVGVALLLRDVGGRPMPSTDPAAEAGVIGFREALRGATYRAILTANFAQGWATMGVRIAVIPLFIEVGLDEGPAWAGVVLACFAAGNMTAILTAGHLSDRLGRRPVMLPGLAIAAVTTGILGVIPYLPVTIALSIIAGIGSGLFAPTHQAALADVLGNRQQGGSALAAYGMSSDLGTVLGPVVVGFIATQAGFGVAFGVTGAVLGVAFLAWLVAEESHPVRAEAGAAEAGAEATGSESPARSPGEQ